MNAQRARLECRHVSKQYRAASGASVIALDDIHLTVYEGEFVCVVGSSGAGKSTLLRILAGLENPTSGSISGFDQSPNGRVGFVFQNDSVFPWRTVERNLTYSLEARHVPGLDRARRATQLCEAVGLPPNIFLSKYPRELSGGEARRVAIGMALSADASVLLMDEPTSQLDYVTRAKLQRTISNLWSTGRPTIVCVTHDIEEAILLGQRIIVLGEGRIRDTIDVDLPFPRSQDVLSSAVALAVRHRTLRCFGDLV